jgi:hypothetical protein
MDQDDELAEWKSKTYQLVGRNILLFQRMEHLLKFLLPRAEFSISLDSDSPSIKTKPTPVIETLGMLVDRFTEEVCNADEVTSSDESHGSELNAKFRLGFETPEGRDALIKRMKSLVKGRNDLVHHFLLQIDANSVESWRSTHKALEEQHRHTFAEIETLRHLVEAMEITCASFAEPEFQRELVCGPIREHLIEKLRVAAEKSAGPDGWTSVSAAIQSDRPISSDAIKELRRHFDVRNLSAFLEAVGGFEIRHDKDQKGGTRTFYRVPGPQSPTATDSASH